MRGVHGRGLMAACAVLALAAVALPAGGMGAPTLALRGDTAVPWGESVRVAGMASAGGAVRVEALAFPFTGAWGVVATATAGPDGAFTATVPVRLNTRLRAVAAGPAGDEASAEVTALALPRTVASTVDRRGRSMVRRVAYRVPPEAAGPVAVRWVAYGGTRAQQVLGRRAGGQADMRAAGGQMVFTRRVAVRTAQPMSGGFCEEVAFDAVGLGPAPRACPTGATAARAQLPARVPEVTVIADSVGTGLDYIDAGRVRATGAWSAVFDLKVCRRLVAPPCPPNPPSALSVIRSQPGSLGDIVVIHVGYNDAGATYDIGRVMSALKARGVRRVVWLNLQGIAPFAPGVNAAVRRAAGRYDWLQVADWSAFSAGRSWFVADRDHLTPTGAAALAGFYRAQIAEAIAALRAEDQTGSPAR